MSNLEEQIVETVNEFLTEIKKKHPETKPFINRRYPFFKKKLETIIPEDVANSQSVEMSSQVNIYYIFYKQTWLRYYDSVFVQKNIRKFASLMLCLKIFYNIQRSANKNLVIKYIFYQAF